MPSHRGGSALAQNPNHVKDPETATAEVLADVAAMVGLSFPGSRFDAAVVPDNVDDGTLESKAQNLRHKLLQAKERSAANDVVVDNRGAHSPVVPVVSFPPLPPPSLCSTPTHGTETRAVTSHNVFAASATSAISHHEFADRVSEVQLPNPEKVRSAIDSSLGPRHLERRAPSRSVFEFSPASREAGGRSTPVVRDPSPDRPPGQWFLPQSKPIAKEVPRFVDAAKPQAVQLEPESDSDLPGDADVLAEGVVDVRDLAEDLDDCRALESGETPTTSALLNAIAKACSDAPSGTDVATPRVKTLGTPQRTVPATPDKERNLRREPLATPRPVAGLVSTQPIRPIAPIFPAPRPIRPLSLSAPKSLRLDHQAKHCGWPTAKQKLTPVAAGNPFQIKAPNTRHGQSSAKEINVEVLSDDERSTLIMVEEDVKEAELQAHSMALAQESLLEATPKGAPNINVSRGFSKAYTASFHASMARDKKRQRL